MTNKLVIVLLIAYFTIVCRPRQVLTQELFGYDDDNFDDFYYPPENYGNSQVTQSSESYKAYLLHPPQCGLSNGEHSRVVNGTPSAPGAWPWMAPIFISLTDVPSEDIYTCGATLISERHILTAAHCFPYVDVTYTVHLGINNIEEVGVRMFIENIVTHPDFNDYTGENDIGIARLHDKISFSDRIRPICLPVAPEIKNKNLTGTYPFVAGWGRTSYEGGTSAVLLEAQIPVVSNPVCKAIYDNKPELGLGFVVGLDDRVICAGYRNGGSDACQGDSGGPFMFPLNQFYYLVGIVSVGHRCAEPGFPGVYTRVTTFLDFILSNMN